MKAKLLKPFVVLVLFMLLMMLASGCANSTRTTDNDQEPEQPAKTEPIVLKYNDINSPQSPQAMFANEFARLVEEKTEGRVKIETYFGGSLVGYDIEPVRSGIADFNQLIPSNVADLEPTLSILDAPYLYKDTDYLLKVVDPRSTVVQSINEKLADKGLVFVTAMPMGFRHITSNKEIRTIDDLKGLKIRVVPSQIYMDTISSFGAVPTPMPFSEVSTALVTGVIDGQENPFSVIVPNGLHEIQKYVSLTGHLPTLAGIFMNKGKFDQLSPEDQDLLFDAAVEARNKITKYIQDKNEEWMSEAVKEGMQIIDESNGLQIDGFKESARQVHDKYKETWGDLYNQIMELGK
mgnify:CR=1 FL=1